MVGEDVLLLQAFSKRLSGIFQQPALIVGESYGGTMLPIAHVLRGNQAKKEHTVHLNLAGLGIGTYSVKRTDHSPENISYHMDPI
jgi:carboxypeptidase C (cathepsin A)